MLHTKIVCTIGPATRSSDVLKALIEAGMNVARVNFSHGTQGEHAQAIADIRAAAQQTGQPVGILADLQGPRLRVGEIVPGGVVTEPGQHLILTTRALVGQGDTVPVQFEPLPHLVRPGDRILLDDGLIAMTVERIEGPDVDCRVVAGGTISSHKGMNLPDTPLDIPAITEKDRADLAFALEHEVDWVALSFVRCAKDVLELKHLMQGGGGTGWTVPVVAKIEKPEGVENIDEIINAADGVMVARGDLAVELSTERVPIVQKKIIRACNARGIPVITATQMLQSMVERSRPTRAEATDVANAILDGSDAVMLSSETAIGKHPVQAVETMARIAVEAERVLPYWHAEQEPGGLRTVAEAVSHAACETAHDLNAVAIITPTLSGHTARTVARFRPRAPVVAVSPSRRVMAQLSLVWGVHPVWAEHAENTDAVLDSSAAVATANGLAGPGDVVIITGGVAGHEPGTTSLMKVHVLT